jgi:hypothetical protein
MFRYVALVLAHAVLVLLVACGDSPPGSADSGSQAGHGGAGSSTTTGTGANDGGGGGMPPTCDETTDLTSDSENCGACGHSCLGGACVAGDCTPVVLAPDLGANLMVVANDAVFVAGFGDISTLSVNGGDVSVFWKHGSGTTTFMKSDGTSLFWTTAFESPGPGRISSQPLQGESATTLAELSAPTLFAVQGTSLFFSEDGEIKVAPKTGGAASGLAVNDGWVAAADDDHLYLATDDSIARMKTDGTEFTTLKSGTFSPRFIQVFEDAIYWVEPAHSLPPDGKVGRMMLDGTQSEYLATGLYVVNGLAVDATGVYWSVSGFDDMEGTLAWLPSDGSPLASVVIGEVGAVATDAAAIYWSGIGGITKLAKPEP